MSLIDQALRAAQREKSRLDEESGRPVAPVLVRLRTPPRQRIDRGHLVLASGTIVTILAAMLWVRSTGEAPLPDVPPVTSTILTEAIASDSVRLQGTPATRTAGTTFPDSARTTSVTASGPAGESTLPLAEASDPHAIDPAVARAADDEPEAESAFDLTPEDRVAAEPRTPPAGTLRIAVERPRNASAARLFAEAIAAHRAQDLPRARNLYERVLALSPSDGDALNNLGVILSTDGEHERAYAYLRRAVAVAPRNAGAWNNIGNLLRERGNADEATAAFRRAIAIDPEHQGARVGLAQQYLAANALPEARELLEAVVRANPTLAEAHYTLGQVLELQGDRAGAVASYSAFVRFASDRLASHVELVRRRLELFSGQ